MYMMQRKKQWLLTKHFRSWVNKSNLSMRGPLVSSPSADSRRGSMSRGPGVLADEALAQGYPSHLTPQ